MATRQPVLREAKPPEATDSGANLIKCFCLSLFLPPIQPILPNKPPSSLVQASNEIVELQVSLYPRTPWFPTQPSEPRSPLPLIPP